MAIPKLYPMTKFSLNLMAKSNGSTYVKIHMTNDNKCCLSQFYCYLSCALLNFVMIIMCNIEVKFVCLMYYLCRNCKGLNLSILSMLNLSIESLNMNNNVAYVSNA
jgi:hypothetical protein